MTSHLCDLGFKFQIFIATFRNRHHETKQYRRSALRSLSNSSVYPSSNLHLRSRSLQPRRPRLLLPKPHLHPAQRQRLFHSRQSWSAKRRGNRRQRHRPQHHFHLLQPHQWHGCKWLHRHWEFTVRVFGPTALRRPRSEFGRGLIPNWLCLNDAVPSSDIPFGTLYRHHRAREEHHVVQWCPKCLLPI